MGPHENREEAVRRAALGRRPPAGGEAAGGAVQPSGEEITRILQSWRDGDEGALDRLIPVVFDDLRRLAHHHFAREPPGHTLQPTAVVSEVYLRLVGSDIGRLADRRQFFTVASRLIREVLVDHARARNAGKRGGGAPRVALDEAAGVPGAGTADPETVIAVHEALSRLERIDPRLSRVAELRYFAGLTQREAAEVLELSLATVERAWSVARRWLAREIGSSR